MKCLVTGGAGFVGTNLIKRLIKEGHTVVSIDNYSSGLKENEQDGCKYIDLDLCEADDISKHIDKVDVIYHLAALARIQTSLSDPVLHIKNNFISTLNVLEYARLQNIPVVYAGSSSKHDGLYGSPYAWVKWSGEELCKLYSSVYDVKMSICRFYNVYGPHQLLDGPYCTVVGVFEEQYKKGKPLTITSDGEQRRDFTHVEDIVDGLSRCGRSLLIPNEYHSDVNGKEFELGRGVNHSINELTEYFGSDYPTEYIPARDGEYDITLCKDDLAHKLLGWRPSINLDEYIKDFVNKTK